MSDLFISYSRDDREFVKQLYAAAKEREKEAWVDWQDIEIGEKFWDEIKKGIDGANSFVFVITPTSIEKAAEKEQYCQREIDYAVNQGKRIIPLVWRDKFLKDERVEHRLKNNIPTHRSLIEINWLEFSENNFSQCFDKLLMTASKDFTYVEIHTKLTIAAQKWEESNRKDKDTLSRGRELAKFTKCLKNYKYEKEIQPRKNSDPILTSKQKEFILASQKHEKARKYLLFLWLFIPFSIFIPTEYGFRESLVMSNRDRLKSTDKQTQREAVINLVSGCYAQWFSLFLGDYIRERLFGNCRSLENTNLSNADLRGINFAGAYMRWVNLDNANASGSNFSGAFLGDSNMRNMSMVNGNFERAILNRVNLKGSNLDSGNFRRADLSGGLFIHATMTNSNFDGVNFVASNLTAAQFNNSDFSNASLGGVEMGCEKNLDESNPYSECTNLSGIRWNENTVFQNIQGFKKAVNAPRALDNLFK